MTLWASFSAAPLPSGTGVDDPGEAFEAGPGPLPDVVVASGQDEHGSVGNALGPLTGHGDLEQIDTGGRGGPGQRGHRVGGDGRQHGDDRAGAGRRQQSFGSGDHVEALLVGLHADEHDVAPGGQVACRGRHCGALAGQGVDPLGHDVEHDRGIARDQQALADRRADETETDESDGVRHRLILAHPGRLGRW